MVRMLIMACLVAGGAMTAHADSENQQRSKGWLGVTLGDIKLSTKVVYHIGMKEPEVPGGHVVNEEASDKVDGTIKEENRNGVVILGVKPGSPADEAGLKSQDWILSLNGTEVKSTGDLSNVMKSYYEGDTIAIEYQRDDEVFETQAVLGSREENLAPGHVIINMHSDSDQRALQYAGRPVVIEKATTARGIDVQSLIDKFGLNSGEELKIEINCEDQQMVVQQGERSETYEYLCEEAEPNGGAPFEIFIKEEIGENAPSSFKLELRDVGDWGRWLSEDPDELAENIRAHVQEWVTDVDLEKVLMLTAQASAKLKFHVDADGTITVTRISTDNSGETAELVQEFVDEADLQSRDPELYQKYQELLDIDE